MVIFPSPILNEGLNAVGSELEKSCVNGDAADIELAKFENSC